MALLSTLRGSRRKRDAAARTEVRGAQAGLAVLRKDGGQKSRRRYGRGIGGHSGWARARCRCGGGRGRRGSSGGYRDPAAARARQPDPLDQASRAALRGGELRRGADRPRARGTLLGDCARLPEAARAGALADHRDCGPGHRVAAASGASDGRKSTEPCAVSTS